MSLDSVLDIGLFALILIFLVIVHEMGHMFVAKWCGMKVERFSVFMGRPLVSYRRGETEYGLGWLPLGGYVKITGMTREEQVAPEDEPRAYYNASTPRKIATIFAGPGVNFVVAFIAFVAIAWIGIPIGQTTNEVAQVTTSINDEQTPAAKIGLMPGDRLVSVNGVAAFPGITEGIRYQINENPGTPIDVVFQRGEQTFTRTAVPALLDEGSEAGRLGFSFQQESTGDRFRYGPADGLDFGWERMVILTEAYGDLFQRLLVDEEARRQVNSVVGAGAIFDVIADDGWISVLLFLGGISFALAFFNLIPVLPLDGGHILVAVVERIIGRPLPPKAYQTFALVGLALILLAFLYILQNDIELIRGGNIAEEIRTR